MARFCRVVLDRLFLLFANSLVVLAEWNTKDFLKKDHSLVKPYQDDHWHFVGSTVVTSNYVRLTSDVRSLQGGIWNTAPCQLRDWELHVHFKVHGTGRDLFGDGLAIWYTKDRLNLGMYGGHFFNTVEGYRRLDLLGAACSVQKNCYKDQAHITKAKDSSPVFGSKDYFMGLGIFLDTYANQNGQHHHGHPYISSMVGNGSLHYDHDLDGTHATLSGCESSFRGSSHETYLAIRYERDRLTVSTDFDGKNTWKLCFYADGVHLPTGYYFGASAATGDLSDNHDILSLKLYDIGVDRKDEVGVDYSKIEPSAPFVAAPRDRVEDSKQGWSSLKIFGYILLSLVVVAGVIGAVVYMKSQQTSRKRFY